MGDEKRGPACPLIGQRVRDSYSNKLVSLSFSHTTDLQMSEAVTLSLSSHLPVTPLPSCQPTPGYTVVSIKFSQIEALDTGHGEPLKRALIGMHCEKHALLLNTDPFLSLHLGHSELVATKTQLQQGHTQHTQGNTPGVPGSCDQ